MDVTTKLSNRLGEIFGKTRDEWQTIAEAAAERFVKELKRDLSIG